MNFRAEVIYRSPESLTPYSKNSKQHPADQIQKIAHQISQYGFDQPIVISQDGVIIKGHGRREAAIQLGLKEVPCIVRSDLDDTAVIGARIGDNKVSESGWDLDFLKFEFGTLERQGLDVSGMTGFELPDIKAIMDGWATDLDKIEKAAPNLDGITGTIKVKCPQEMRAELSEFIRAQIAESGFEGVTIE